MYPSAKYTLTVVIHPTAVPSSSKDKPHGIGIEMGLRSASTEMVGEESFAKAANNAN